MTVTGKAQKFEMRKLMEAELVGGNTALHNMIEEANDD